MSKNGVIRLWPSKGLSKEGLGKDSFSYIYIYIYVYVVMYACVYEPAAKREGAKNITRNKSTCGQEDEFEKRIKNTCGQ